ncbi:hypothetical protein NEUTE1DRAFT_104243 [Neurospora tetrasperma FGSC 2508]|uniref:Rhodopsin domain-containing protein n=1 Tax=Neurospora tetrasperma (strain FGSC 2508 / ATCC MYA-4615 / P0657) TaxID=510951 RepID=F8MVX7_NEUT8|nr:uncharacterized protein NEUTE1DRAFT_104243 [Neurospora tetrasperma FGSC 2508]EGO54825.1 hypothetical protein NEUTE1DRAFT_104243 [Neurospora tetrasperma FGSC 2508]EGZ67688.1 hypothetical protein NEUTE2DRAFT_74385 [Neurospora tetrasperma FGSC 2509]
MNAQSGLTMHNYKQDGLFAAIVVGFVTSSLSTGFRFWARRRTVKVWRRDDWFMLAGLLWSWGVIAAILHGLTVGLGEEAFTTDHDKLWLPRTNSAMLMFQNWGVFCVKASILFFNMNLFKGRISTKFVWTVFGITFINSFTGFFIAFLQEIAACPRADKQCFGESKFVVPLTTGIISTLCDIVIYIMPIPILVRLGVNRRTKLGLCCVFLLGLLCIATSFARWAAMLQNHPKDDVTMPSSIGISLWTFVELSAGITCGNLPVLAPMFGCVGPRRGRGTELRKNLSVAAKDRNALTFAPLFHWKRYRVECFVGASGQRCKHNASGSATASH